MNECIKVFGNTGLYAKTMLCFIWCTTVYVYGICTAHQSGPVGILGREKTTESYTNHMLPALDGVNQLFAMQFACNLALEYSVLSNTVCMQQ